MFALQFKVKYKLKKVVFLMFLKGIIKLFQIICGRNNTKVGLLVSHSLLLRKDIVGL